MTDRPVKDAIGIWMNNGKTQHGFQVAPVVLPAKDGSGNRLLVADWYATNSEMPQGLTPSCLCMYFRK